MKNLAMVIFVTKKSSESTEHELQNYAILYKGKRPCWHLHVGRMVFRIIPSKKHILEDGLWQLIMYTQIPEDEYSCDVHYNKPFTLVDEFGKKSCKRNSAEIDKEGIEGGLEFKVFKWSEEVEPNLAKIIQAFSEQGLNISLAN